MNEPILQFVIGDTVCRTDAPHRPGVLVTEIRNWCGVRKYVQVEWDHLPGVHDSVPIKKLMKFVPAE